MTKAPSSPRGTQDFAAQKTMFRGVLIFTIIVLVSVLTGCGGSSSSNVSDPPSAGTISTVAGDGLGGYHGDGGPATSAELWAPLCVALDGNGNLYIADTNNNVVRKMTPGGTISTVAGSGASGYSGDGGPATSATLNFPSGIALDGAGNVYIADTENNVIRKVTAAGTITTLAGTGKAGYSGDHGQATSAELNAPWGLTLDTAGDLYIADSSNNLIRRVAPTGTITSVAGTGKAGYSGDSGPAISATLHTPSGVTLDTAGDLYIADMGNAVIRKVTAGGSITTVAGTGKAGYSGDNGPATSAELAGPMGVAVDGSGNIYIAIQGNQAVRKVTPGGTISTVAGIGLLGYSGNGGPATSARLWAPGGVTLDGSGGFYIADTLNNVIRRVSAAE